MRLSTITLVSLGILAAAPVSAQAPLDSYVTVIRADSVAFHYNPEYGMQQPACAAIRRFVRLDKDGAFHGAFRDVRAGDSLVATGSYVHGQKEGIFTLFHRSGKPAARGLYQHNQRTGEWEYWYPSGQRQQTLRFGADGKATVVSYWDAAGAQRAQAGNGEWHRIGGSTTIGGPVVNGHAAGQWQRTATDTGKLLATETFDTDGRLKQGRLLGPLLPGATATYRDDTRMGVAEDLWLVNAERYQLQPPCSQQQAAANRAKAAGSFAPATYKDGFSGYWELLWIRIRPVLRQDTPLGRYHGVLRFTLNLDATGGWQTELFKTEGTDLEAARQLLQMMRNLPKWEPARLNGVAVPSSVRLEYRALAPSYSLGIMPQQGTVDTGFSAAPAR